MSIQKIARIYDFILVRVLGKPEGQDALLHCEDRKKKKSYCSSSAVASISIKISV
jgi:hypothetical protein